MTELERLEQALRAAAAAGDEAAARRFATEIRRLQAQAPVAAPVAPREPSPRPAAANDPDVRVGPPTLARGSVPAAQMRPFSGEQPALLGPPGAPGPVRDALAGLGSGVVRGAAALADLPQMAMRGAEAVPGMIAGAVGLDRATMDQAMRGVFPASQIPTPSDVATAVAPGVMGYDPTTTVGQYAQNVGEFVPGAAIAGGGIRGLLTYALAPGMASEFAGTREAIEGTAAEPWVRIGAAILAPIGVNALERVARRAITPNPGTDPERARMAADLRRQGIEVTAGQETGVNRLRRAEGATTAGEELGQRQLEQLTRRTMELIGSNAPRATDDALVAARDRIGGVFEDVARGVTVPPSAQHVAGLQNVLDDYNLMVAGGQQSPIIGEILNRLNVAYRSGGAIPARNLMGWRSQLSRATRAGGETAYAAGQAIEVLDDALATALNAAGRADDVARFATARDQWRGLLMVERAATQAGEAAQAGLLTPGALYQAITAQGRQALALGGRGELGDLVRAARGVIQPLPTSGTAENIRAMGMPGATGALAGTTAAGAVGLPPAAGALVGALAAPATNALRMTAAGQAWLRNQALTRGPDIIGPGIVAPAATAVGARE